MKNEALVSVIIPCYNAEIYIEAALMSILQQSYHHLEVIVINDGSTDKSAEILLQFAQQDLRVRYIENEKNLGLIATLNKGIQLAQGKYIARMDADDIALPDRIEKQVETAYAFQELEDIPEEYKGKFQGRTKPWGTGQAVLAAKKVIKTPFIVINADDYYGKEGFKAVHEYLV